MFYVYNIYYQHLSTINLDPAKFANPGECSFIELRTFQSLTSPISAISFKEQQIKNL